MQSALPEDIHPRSDAPRDVPAAPAVPPSPASSRHGGAAGLPVQTVAIDVRRHRRRHQSFE